MKRTGKPLMLTLGSLLLAGNVGVALADTPENPYRVIVDRNAFGLKPVPPPPPAPPPAPPPPVNVKLTGISKVGNVIRAHMMTEEPGKPGHFKYYTLGLEEKSDAIEVLEINEEKESVKIRNGDKEAVINFKDNGVKGAAPLPPPVIMPGQTGMAAPGVINTSLAPGTPQGSSPVIVSSRGANSTTGESGPARGNVVVGSTPGEPFQSAVQQYKSVMASDTLRPIPTRAIRTMPVQQQQPQVPQTRLSAEEQVLLLEANRLQAEKRGETMPPTPGLPHTTINPPTP